MSKVILKEDGTKEYINIIPLDLKNPSKEIIYKEFWIESTVGLIESCAKLIIKAISLRDKENAEIWTKYMKKYTEEARIEINKKEENALEIAFEKRIIDLETYIIQTRQIVSDQDAVNLSGVTATDNE